ncbi:MAG: hypothetical protein H6712_29695 [Myxococcales bacterium]|nr:hypothetical protein [Myxococcales bacterium]MCB9718061.1 hypothetical protein [Myxococcales bacterium]
MNRLLPVVASLAILSACGKDDPGLGATDGEADSGSSTGSETDPRFGAEQVYPLRLNEQTPAPLVLEMTRDEVAELFGDAAAEVRLLSLDPSPLLSGTIAALRNACGTAWQQDDPDPHHDCALTELGQSFGQFIPWQLSPEYGLVRLLTMTPANVDVTGTTTEHLAALVDALASVGEIDPFSVVLGSALGVGHTEAMISDEALVASLRENLVATHPAVGPAGQLEVTLADALSDLGTLAVRYGPAGDHPGIISEEVGGQIFGPDFRMRVVADSNLRIMDGADASHGKGFVTVADDRTGPTFDDELEFDFDDPERFGLQGVVDDLRVDLRVTMLEHDAFVPTCVGDPPCQANLPGEPVDDTSVWALPPWSLERIVTAAALHDFGERVYFTQYVMGLAQVLIGQNGDPPGWIHYEIEAGLGDPPGDQYLWETVLEVAQVALHHTPYADYIEGGADVAFTVRDIPVGLTGAEATEALRPYLGEQAGLLSDLLLGDYRDNNDPVDFHYRRGDDGQTFLFFTAADDLPLGVEYTYPTPGFFADAELSDKVSDTLQPGVSDLAHEKVPLGPGETVLYFADDTGQVYRVRVTMPEGDDTEIEVAIAARED